MEEAELRLAGGYRHSYASTDTLLTPVTPTNSLTLPVSDSSSKIEALRRSSLSHRLRRRQDVLQQRKRLVDLSFVLGITGILLVVVDTELCLAGIISEDSWHSLTLQLLTSLSTVCLLLAIVAYHVTGVKLHVGGAGFQEWRLVLWNINWWKLAFELLICVLHPLPFKTFDLPTSIVKVGSEGRQVLVEASLPLNGVLIILMFLRLYLLGRVVFVHSRLFLDTSVQTVGALSRVQIKAGFVFRAVMSTCPMVVLGSWMVSTFFISSWNLRVCEVYTDPDSEYARLGQSMWLTAVTFLTVGYGDLVPRSYCARLMASFTGLMGVGSMALSVAVLAKKLEQPRAEKYVHTFVRQMELDKRRRHAAADVVKQAFRIVRDLNRGRAPHSTLIIRHRSRMIRAMRAMQVAQFHKAGLSDTRVGPVEVQMEVSNMQETVDSIQSEQRQLAERVSNLETLAMSVCQHLADIKHLLKDQ